MTPAENKNSKLIILLLSVALLLVTVSLGAVVYFSFVKPPKSDTLTITDVDETTAQKLAGTIVYKSGEDTYDYFSPVLNLTFNYDQSFFFLSESSDAVILSDNTYGPRSTRFLATIKKLGNISDTEVYEHMKTEFSASEEMIETEKEEAGGVKVRSFTYKVPVLVGEGTKDETLTFLYKSIDGQILIIKAQSVSPTETDRYYGKLLDLLNSINTDVSEIASDIVVSLYSGGATVPFDRNSWEVIYQDDSTVSLGFRSRALETNEEFKLDSSNFKIRLNPLYETLDTSTAGLYEKLLKDTSYLEGVDYFEDFTYLNKDLVTNVGGIEFYGIQLSYIGPFSESANDRTYREFYIGIIPALESYATIEVEHSGPSSAAYPASRKVMEKVTFSDSVLGTSSENVLGTNTVEIKKASIIGTPATGHIFNRSCVSGKFENIEGFPTISNKTYNVCTAGFGSGFWVNENGYMITNSHVVTPNMVDTFFHGGYSKAASGTGGWLQDILTDVLPIMLANNYDIENVSAEELVGVAAGVMNEIYKSGALTLTLSEHDIYIQTGTIFDRTFQIDPESLALLNPSAHRSASVVNTNELASMFDTQESNVVASVPDIALIKLDTPPSEKLPVVGLSDPDVISVGQEIFVVGFPGIAENQSLFSTQSSAIPTVTSGTISAIKPNPGNNFNLLQIDASIDNGNSGGPILATDGTVVGIATYGIQGSTSGNYNAGVSVEEIVKVLSLNNVSNSEGEVTQLLRKGLDEMDNMHYSRAVESFNAALALNSSLDNILDPLIKISDAKIDSGEDKTPMISLLGYDIPDYVLFISLGLLILAIILALIALILHKKRPKVQTVQTPKLPTPESPAAVQEQPAVTAQPLNS